MDIIFYDGACGLCHRFVSFTVRRDRSGWFHFAPLGGPTFLGRVAPPRRHGLPDSVAVLTADGHLLTRSAATLYVLRRLGGLWKTASLAAGVLPRPLLDAVYDAIAGVRHRLFEKPAGLCPVLPPAWRERFLP